MGDAEIVTMLFTDLVGSTELLDRLGDDAADELRQTHFRLLRRAVADSGGDEVKNIGDGLMVVFSSARDALRCAVAMQHAVHDHNWARPAAHGADLQVRIGVHVGEPIRTEGDYFGATVNVAARLCAAAGGGRILTSQLVCDLVGSRGSFEFRPVEPLSLKGFARPVGAAEVMWRYAERRAGPAFRVLGSLEVIDADGAPISLTSTRQRILLAYLLAHAGRTVSTEQLVAALWETDVPAHPRDALQSQVARLRTRLGASAVIETLSAGYRFASTEVIDAARFERLLAEGRALRKDPKSAIEVWDAALSLWRGPAYLDLADHPALRPTAVRLNTLRTEAAEARVGALLDAQRVPDALAAAEILAAEEPLGNGRPSCACARSRPRAGTSRRWRSTTASDAHSPRKWAWTPHRSWLPCSRRSSGMTSPDLPVLRPPSRRERRERRRKRYPATAHPAASRCRPPPCWAVPNSSTRRPPPWGPAGW